MGERGRGADDADVETVFTERGDVVDEEVALVSPEPR